LLRVSQGGGASDACPPTHARGGFGYRGEKKESQKNLEKKERGSDKKRANIVLHQTGREGVRIFLEEEERKKTEGIELTASGEQAGRVWKTWSRRLLVG